MNEKLKDKRNISESQEMLSVLRKMEKHLQDLVFYMTPEKAFLSSAGRIQDTGSNEEAMQESKIREMVTKEVKKRLKERK